MVRNDGDIAFYEYEKLGVEQKFIDVNGIRTRYLEGGKGNPEHIMLVHGITASADRWHKVIKPLSEKYHVIAPDLPGYGYSDKPYIGYEIGFFSDHIKRLMESLGISSVHMIGSSLGGYIAADFGIRHGRMVKKMVLCSPAGFIDSPTAEGVLYYTAVMMPTTNTVRSALKEEDDWKIKDFINRAMLPGAKHAYCSTLMYMHPRRYREKNGHGLEDGLKKIRSHTLVIWGDDDKIIPIEHMKDFTENIPNSSKAVISGGCHIPYDRVPEIFMEVVSDFLDGSCNIKKSGGMIRRLIDNVKYHIHRH